MFNLTNHFFRRVAPVLTLCIMLAAAMTAQARDIHVRGDCSLRDAIRAANYDTEIDGCVAGAGADRIILHENSVQTKSIPEITSNITLEGNGRKVTIGDKPAFVIDEGQLTLRNINIRFEMTRNGDVLTIVDGALRLANAYFHDCTGGMDVEDSTIQLLGNSRVCNHSRDVVWNWFDYTPPPPPTCAVLSHITVRAAQGLANGPQCRDVDAAAVGNQVVYNAGFIDAVDVFGDLGSGVEVCFPQIGALMFLDAAMAPRVASSIASYSVSGMTCAFLQRAGMLVLVQGQPSSVAPSAAGPASVPEPAPAPAPGLSEPSVEGCPIRTTGHINFRAEPSLDAEKLGAVLRGTTVGAVSRIWGWYEIIFQGQRGWIGGRYVDNIGNC